MGKRKRGERMEEEREKKKNPCDPMKRESCDSLFLSLSLSLSSHSFVLYLLNRSLIHSAYSLTRRSIPQEWREEEEERRGQHFWSATPAVEQCAAICHAFQSVLDVPLIGIQMDINISPRPASASKMWLDRGVERLQTRTAI